MTAPSSEAVRRQAARLAAFVRSRPSVGAVDLARALAGRSRFKHRAVVVGSDRDELLRGLELLADGGEAPGVVDGVVARRRGVGMVFSGQGSQRPGMGLAAASAFPAFADAFDEVVGALDARLPRPLRAVIAAAPDGPDGGVLDQTVFTQAGLFAVQVALFRLMESWGITPTAVSGHSIGLVAAAHAAGVLDLPDACRLVAARGSLMQDLPAGGAMAALDATQEQAQELLAGHTDHAGIAAVNGPASTVVSGDADVVVDLVRRWTTAGGRARRLTVSHAFHSPLMEPMLAAFASTVDDLTFRQPRMPLLTGDADAQVTDPAFWVRHVRQPVRFAGIVEEMAVEQVGAVLELGPDGSLSSMAAAVPDDGRSGPLWIPALRPDRSDPRAIVTAVAVAHTRGAAVDWTAVLGR